MDVYTNATSLVALSIICIILLVCVLGLLIFIVVWVSLGKNTNSTTPISSTSTRKINTRAIAKKKSEPEFRFISTSPIQASPMQYKKTIVTPKNDEIAIDATAIGPILYTLNSKGYVSSFGLTRAAKNQICEIEQPPDKIVSLTSAGEQLIARSANGNVYNLKPCAQQCQNSVCTKKANWRIVQVRNTDGNIMPLKNVTHISISPNGERAWVQTKSHGQMCILNPSDRFWNVEGKMITIGSEPIVRIIGDDGEFTDFCNDTCMRNKNPELVQSDVKGVAYAGIKNEPSIVSSMNVRRVTPGRLTSFPCKSQDLYNELFFD